MLAQIVKAGLKTGAILSATTIGAIMLAGKRETGSAWSPLNAICHIVDGDEVSQPNEFSPRASLLGLGLNATIMFAWATLYEGALAVTRKKSGPLPAAAAATAAYVIDYKLVPPRYTPGIEKKIGHGSVLAVYAVLAATHALSPLWNSYDTPSTETQAE